MINKKRRSFVSLVEKQSMNNSLALLLVIQVIFLFMHWFIYETLILLLHIESPFAVALLRYSLLFLAFSFTLASLLAIKYKNAAARWFYILGSVWAGVLYFLFIASFFGWIAFDFILSPDYAVLVTGALFALAIAIAIYGVVNARRPRVTNISFVLPSLPAGWAGKTAVFVSDVHAGHVRHRRFVEEVVEKINEINPSAVFIGGDFYDGLAVDLDAVTEPLSRLTAPLGVYFVTGNHEQLRDDTPYTDTLRKFGVRVVHNEVLDVGGLQVVGADYGTTRKKTDYKKMLAGLNLDPDRPSILLRHVPNYMRHAENRGISVQLSGHTHNGQVFPLDIISAIIYKRHHRGLKKYKSLSVYTSSGAGTWGPPLRVGTKSEMVVIKFLDRKPVSV